jgi:hypothetical protein
MAAATNGRAADGEPEIAGPGVQVDAPLEHEQLAPAESAAETGVTETQEEAS